LHYIFYATVNIFQEREEELRLLSIELRRKEREKRHLEREDIERMSAAERKNKDSPEKRYKPMSNQYCDS
jgi:hypothetical protein